ncbi:MAG TPA: zinc-binding dehydrogenase [Pirellulales bacterium]|nr:zinc-binding dehydrogenase [Pirellulales bacterium]
MNTALAAIFEGTTRQLVLRELPVPQPRRGEILVRVLGCTLCGSDLHSFAGRRSVPVPTVLGHEIVGEIAALGEAAPASDLVGEPLRIGDRITWAIVASCGDCYYCCRGLEQKCERAVKYGHEPFGRGRELTGGLAEFCLLAPGTGIVRLPAELPLATACPASCATGTVTAALQAAGDLQDRVVIVLGAGMLGVTACALASVAGAKDIIAVDQQADRRTRALRFGATRVAPLDELPDAVKAASDNHGADVIIELTGSPAVFETALPLARLGGSIVLVGSVFPQAPIPLALEQIVRRNLNLHGVHNYRPQHLVASVRFLTATRDRFPWSSLVEKWYPLREAATAFDTAAGGTSIRIGVRPE